MCYYCTKAAASGTDLVGHQLLHHLDQETERKFSIRKLEFDESLGYKIYRSKHFGVPLTELQKQQKDGKKIYIDEEQQKVLYKRPVTYSSDEHSDEYDSSIDQQTISNGLKVLQSIGRDQDFVAVMEALANGKLSTKNMALHLLLDVGMQLRNEQFQVRYSQTTLDFWLIVQKLFRGKGIRFFRGFSGACEREGN